MNTRLFLLFDLNSERFAVDTASIVEIIPLVEIIRVPRTAPYIGGLIHYRGSMLTIIDAARLLYDATYNKRLCTRIIILSVVHNEQPIKIGLIAEKVNRTCYLDSSKITKHGLTHQNAPYLGEIVNHEEGNIQILNLEQLVQHEFENLHYTAQINNNNHNEISL